jgi:MioC protein
MASIQIIVGSMLGGTEYVAEACEQTLKDLQHETTLHLQPNFAEIAQKDQIWLICTSTHGAGDFPDNIKTFVQDLENSNADLSTTKFLVIGVGDSSYDTFCNAAKMIENILLSMSCIKICEKKLIDMQENIDPELLSQQWIEEINDQLS